MSSDPYPKLELKYCERCGGLWLRLQGSDAVYCAACAEAVRQLPPVTRGGGSGALQHGCAPILMFLFALCSILDCLGGACS